MKPRSVAFALLLSLSLGHATAWSQDDAATLQARTRFKEGVEAFDKGRYEEARLAFLQAYSLKKHPSVLLNLAQSSAKSNHPLEAARYFQQFLKDAVTATPQQKRDAEAGLSEARQKLGRIEIVAPAGTEISLDEQGRVGTTPMDPIDVDPGQHIVKSPSQTVTVIAVIGQRVEARLGAAPSATAAPVAPVAPLPTPGKAAPPVEPAPAQPAPAAADAGPSSASSGKRPTSAYVGLGVGLGVGVLAGASAVVFGIAKGNAQKSADDNAATIRAAAITRFGPGGAQGVCNAGHPEFAKNCAGLKKSNSDVDTDALIANISIGVAAAGVAFGLIWFFATPKRDEASTSSALAPQEPKKPMLVPYAGWNNGGLMLTGEF